MEAKKTDVIPWDYHGSANREDANNKHRLKIYRKFIGRNHLECYSLDIGQSNYIGRCLGVQDNTLPTNYNYDIGVKGTNYLAITCFEVINHVMNPLQFMEQIHSLLREGGICYLSAPKLWLVPWHHCKYNFVNYKPSKLKVLFEYAGFKAVRCETHNPWPWWFMFCGFRPFFRTLLNRIQVWELRR